MAHRKWTRPLFHLLATGTVQAHFTPHLAQHSTALPLLIWKINVHRLKYV